MKSFFKFRRARFPEDSAKISEIVAVIWQGGADAILEKQYGQIGHAPWHHYQAQAVIDWMQSPSAQAYVVTGGDEELEIVAFCSFQIDHERDTATVGYNGVSPIHQGCGLGTQMMTFVMNQIRESGVGYAAVMVAGNDEHLPARRVYEKAGFQTVYGLRFMFQKLT